MNLLGIDLGGTNVRVGKIVNNHLEKVLTEPINSRGSESEIIDQISNLIEQLKDKGTEGIGIGVPSVVDVEKGIIYDVMNIPSWKEVHLKKIYESRFAIPVQINNDANCFAVGEKYFGKCKKYKNVIGLIVGTGLGAGLILNNKLYSGTNCGAGEFGCIPYLDKYLEYYASGQFFKNIYNTDGGELAQKAAAGDPNALKIFNEFGSHLGYAIKIIMYSNDPEIIILGGSVSKSFGFYKDSVFKSLQDFVYPNSLKKIKIEVSELEQVAILGAAALYLDSI
jgi:glucokinase